MGKLFNNYSQIIPSLLFICLLIILEIVSFNWQNNIYKPTELLQAAKNADTITTSGIITSDAKSTKSLAGTVCLFDIKTESGFWLQIQGIKQTIANQNNKTINLTKNWCDLKYHDSIEFTAKLSPIDFKTKSDNPANRLAAKAQINKFTILQYASGLDYITNVIRAAFIDMTDKLNPVGRALVPAIALGYTNNFDDNLSDNFKISGLTHLVAISGSHFVIIISLIGVILLAFNIKKTIAAGIEIICILAFMSLVHPQPSVIRAAFMGIIGLVGLILQRKSLALTALSATIITLLIIDPYLATSYGFAMSCSAALGIILLTPKLTILLSRFIGKTIASIVSVTLAAQFFCGPIIILIYPFFTPYTLMANFLATPFVAPATILGVLSALISPLIPQMAYILAFSSTIFAYPLYIISKLISFLPLAKLAWVNGLIGCLLMILLNIILYWTISGKIWNNTYKKIKKVLPAFIESKLSLLYTDITQKIKHYKVVFLQKPILILTLIALLFIPLVITGSIILPKYFITTIDPNWKIAACNIGQGDASVIKTSQNSAIVIDVGSDNNKINNCLSDLNIQTIDLLILSHWHDDHVGGLLGAINNRQTKQAIVSNLETPTGESKLGYNKLQSENIPTSQAKEGESGYYIDNNTNHKIQWYIFQTLKSNKTKSNINTNSQTSTKSTNNEDSFSNDSSVGVIIYSNNLKAIFLGDMEKQAQAEALKRLKQLNMGEFDILKVAHHGSKTQNNDLAKLINPKIAIFEVGRDNSYGHPNDKTINLFTNLGSQIIRTDIDGLSGVSQDSLGNIKIFKQNYI
ncbi:MAG: ComEC/Rec2 family competence protein [Bifidobacteriaceae bacterium]|jgi:competence protein ComEC|nr:ComEC/Rec2 family competence protein [Bifidobacteriaceae bacterium]